MELSQDWRKLQSTFFPSSFPMKGSVGVSAGTGTLYCIQDQSVLIQAFSEGEDLSDWIGATMNEVRSQFPNRVIIEWDRKSLEASLLASLGEAHLDAQIAQWRQDVRDQASLSTAGELRGVANSRKDFDVLDRHLVSQRHFLLDALKDSWWTRVLPSSFGIFFRFEGGGESRAAKDFLLVYRKGKLEQFGVPDLNFMGVDRRKDSGDVAKYLSDRFMVPVQGVLLREEDWVRWSADSSPWREIAWAVQSNRVQLVPFRWSLVSMLAARGLLGF
jgi:hypothetical protein